MFENLPKELNTSSKVGLNDEVNSKTYNSIIAEKRDYSKYEFNNWKALSSNTTVNKIDKQKGAIWLNPKGEICYRFSNNGDIFVSPHNKANIVFSNYLSSNIKLISGTKEESPNIYPNELLMIQSDTFNPFKLQEFYREDNLHYRNVFKPTSYLQMKQVEYEEPKTILKLIKHLCNYDESRYKYTINWLAYFFNGLKKSQVALVLRGVQGSGKGILFNEAIKPLFGSDYCITVNDKSLDTNFLGGIVENRLFFNLDEISHNIAGNKNVKNFLKALVTNDSITAEKKHQNLDKETKIFGQILITSNEPYILEVETSDRRYTVFTTGGNLKKSKYLGHSNYLNFSTAIKNELEDFCLYLKSYKTDNDLANKALDTAEKKALVNATNDKFKMFVDAIINKNLDYFAELEEYDEELYEELKSDFTKDRIKQPNLYRYFIALYDDEKLSSSKGLMTRLRAIEPMFFDESNMSKSSGYKYFEIKSI